MTLSKTTQNLTVGARTGQGEHRPGGLVVWSGTRPTHRVLYLQRGVLELGRELLHGFGIDDPRMSRRHTLCEWQRDGWLISDMGSRNKTQVWGQPLPGPQRFDSTTVVRLGDTIVLLTEDVSPFADNPVKVDDRVVMGAAMAQVARDVQIAAQGRVLHITGPSGAGKELAAKLFHQAGPSASSPLVAVNCATIPEGVAERVLFGAKRGAYSGASHDTTGHVQEADGGTLFLDEVGELDLSVQAKLLRVLETGEVMPLGSSQSTTVNVRWCSATHRNLAEAIADKAFREDLYFRLGRPSVAIPPLRDRLDELPWLVDLEVRAHELEAHASLVETCLTRPWPGNIRELRVEVAAAARAAGASGDGRVRDCDLTQNAGQPLVAPEADRLPSTGGSSSRSKTALPSREEIEEALRRCEGRVASAARDLGLHRNQLRRWLTKTGIDPKQFGPDEGDGV